MAWLLTGIVDSQVESTVDQEIVQILRDVAWLGVRNSVAATAILLGLLYLSRQLSLEGEEYDSYREEAEESQDVSSSELA